MLSTIDFLAASVCLYYGNKLYNSTRGAADFWLFLSAFIASLGAYTLFDFTRKVLFVHYDIPLRSAQDLTLAFAAIFALISAIYAKKMFDKVIEE